MTLQRWQPVSSCTITWMEICDIGQWVRADEAEAEIAFLAKRGDDLAEKLTRFTKHCGVERLQNELLLESLKAASDVAGDYLRMREELIALKDRHLDSCDGRWLDTHIDEILNPKGGQ